MSLRTSVIVSVEPDPLADAGGALINYVLACDPLFVEVEESWGHVMELIEEAESR